MSQLRITNVFENNLYVKRKEANPSTVVLNLEGTVSYKKVTLRSVM